MILTIVALPQGTYGTAEEARVRTESSAARFQKIPGLLRKDYVRGDFDGGAYLWESRAAAEAYLTGDWLVRMTKMFGRAPEVTYLDVPCIVDNERGDVRVNPVEIAAAAE